jgi:hypothetical protein
VRTYSRLRRSLRIGPLLALALGLAACGGDTVSLDPVASAASRTAQVSTQHMSMTAVMQLPGVSQTISFTAEGAVDNRARRGEIAIDMSSLAGALPPSAHALSDPGLWRGKEVFDASNGLVVYMNFPFLAQSARLTKPWIRFDVGSFAKKLGFDFDQLMQMSGGDPTRQLEYLRATSGEVRKLGTAKVRGVTTTHYRAHVDLSKYPKLLPESQRGVARSSVEALTKLTGASTFPVEVWVDNRNLVRRMRMVMVMKAPQGPMTMWMTLDFYGFGTPVNVELPPADQVTDLAELAASG